MRLLCCCTHGWFLVVSSRSGGELFGSVGGILLVLLFARNGLMVRHLMTEAFGLTILIRQGRHC